ncbi:MAG: class I SAM-dependent methyltransferase [Burkholderiales bacterium]|nr:class I SAM-dependent methyltransferase [Burkholderiales bacterium]
MTETGQQYQDTFPIAHKLEHLRFDWQGKSVAEVGCNAGALAPYVTERGARSYVGSDLIASYVEAARARHPGFTYHHLESADAPVDADVLVVLGVFHHMSDEQVRALLHRTTAREVICEQPMSGLPFENYRMRPFHWYLQEFNAAGFAVVEIVPYGFRYPVERAILCAHRT